PWAGDVHLDLLLPGILVAMGHLPAVRQILQAATGFLPAVRQILQMATGFLPVRQTRLVPQSPVVQKDH
ncbi:MAG: hypothetical protein VYA27_13755, partial [Verrucomicrobiota bacterium]|nr:hypothetical protein [Verrucomicrobiota bacterium]